MTLQRTVFVATVFVCIGSAHAATLCSSTESVLYSCRTSKKMISVCAKDLGTEHGYMQYRFGSPAKVELSVPADPSTPTAAGITANTLMFSGGGGAYIRFRADDYDYVVYTAIGKGWGEKNGVAIDHKGKLVSHVACTDEPVSELGPDLFDKAGLKTDPNDFDLP